MIPLLAKLEPKLEHSLADPSYRKNQHEIHVDQIRISDVLSVDGIRLLLNGRLGNHRRGMSLQ